MRPATRSLALMPRRPPRSTWPVVVAAPDKFRGTASAHEVCDAIRRAADRCGWECVRHPLADGGEGTLDALGGPNRTTVVSGPLGDPVEASWRYSSGTAVIEMAQASGLAVLAPGERNDPVAASTYGTGELIAAAAEAGAKRIVVAVGGSATTDGGLGALRALNLARLTGIELIVACDVDIRFVAAAEVFAPQKGASPAQVELLSRRLERLVQVYVEEYGVDVSELPGSGAAGGLAGGLAAIGARLESGFELVSDELALFDDIERATLVVTGEGYLDDESFHGKVVGGVLEGAEELEIPVLVVAGDLDPHLERAVDAVSLAQRFGHERAMTETLECIEAVVEEHLRSLG